ncbi:AAA family ATPase [Polaromonas sp. YR568]|uniref:AAA family ATPase n=1 Tax=Polaromonas sp. YR568 TaxID=1855301 RepID=UPI003137BBD5
MTADVEAIVDSVTKAPTEIPSIGGPTNQVVKHYTLLKLEAHKFGGLHHPGTATQAPKNFVYDFKSDVTMFEGSNGCGKTSLLNAIIWALTGEILRPQRLPELAANEFQCEIDGENDADGSTHKLIAVMPLPDPMTHRPTATLLPADTWVELTFRDETGVTHSPVRRTLTRTARGKIEDSVTGIDALSLDPVSLRTGTVMPGMLPFIQLGGESKLGKAVAELTGMAPLVKLASHADRAKRKIDGDLTKDRNRDIEKADIAYDRSHADLTEKVSLNPSIAYSHSIPKASSNPLIEAALTQAIAHFDGLKATALADARQVLGAGFDASEASARRDLEDSIAPATVAVRGLATLPSAARLSALAKLTEEELTNTQARLDKIYTDVKILTDLAADPSKAGRIRLYSRLSAWAKEHPHAVINEDLCIVCGQELEGIVDPVTGLSVKQHLHDATKTDAALLSQTLASWSSFVLGELARELPVSLQQELRQDLPLHPGELIRMAVVDELFSDESFLGVLGELKTGVQTACDVGLKKLPPLPTRDSHDISTDLPELTNLQIAIRRVNVAIDFSKWRKDHKTNVGEFTAAVVGQASKEGLPTAPESLLGHLQRLQVIVEGVEPITQALILCRRMEKDIAERRAVQKRLESYGLASVALQECMKVGSLAEQQVDQLQVLLQRRAVAWRNRIYQGAFPSTNHDLVASRMSGEGQLELMVGANGLAAPAQHVANASALRASLVGFFLAYWEYLLSERGGLRMLLLDDPQELLDGDNRERLAKTVGDLVKANAQLIVTTHDAKFAMLVARSANAASTSFDHQSVLPATRLRGTLYLSPSVSEVQKKHEAHLADPDSAGPAQDYASECRVFIEGRLGDIFDDTAFPSTTVTTFAPTLSDHLGRLRGLVKNGSNELFRSPLLKKLSSDPALKDGAPTLALLNKAHHGSKATITATDVATAHIDLERLRRSVEDVHEEFRLYRRRDRLQPIVSEIPSLAPNIVSKFDVPILPNLAAFVRGGTVGESQETDLEKINSTWFEDKSFFLLRTSNFGFAGRATSVAIVETEPSAVEDRRLVIARRANDVYARRLLRPSDSHFLALAAETPDPRRSPQTLLFQENEIATHRVVGMLFGDAISVPASKSEAVQIDGAGLLQQVLIAYRIREDSAIPLALPDQIALGNARIALNDFDQHLDAYVALHLSDGTSIFKRVGEKLPAPLSHLRRFETIGGLGVADVLAIGQPQAGFKMVEHAVLVLGVLYRD